MIEDFAAMKLLDSNSESRIARLMLKLSQETTLLSNFAKVDQIKLDSWLLEENSLEISLGLPSHQLS